MPPTVKGIGPVDSGIEYIVEQLLPLDDEALATACRTWSASPFVGEAFEREQARLVWALRRALPAAARSRFDGLPPAIQAQLAELRHEVFTSDRVVSRSERHA
jgi:hypothetical protein